LEKRGEGRFSAGYVFFIMDFLVVRSGRRKNGSDTRDTPRGGCGY
jgi:hypothetical protein